MALHHWRTGGISPVIGPDGAIYVGSDDNNLYVINPDGSKQYFFTTGNDVDGSAAIAPDGTVYFGSQDGYFYIFNVAKEFNLNFPASAPIESSPTLGAGGTAYFGDDGNTIYAVLPKPDAVHPHIKLKWTFSPIGIEFLALGSPAMANNRIYVGFAENDNELYALNNRHGKLKWASPIGGFSSSPAIGKDGTIYVGTNDAKLYAINPDGSTKWSSSVLFGLPVLSSPAIGPDGTIYVGSGTPDIGAAGNLYAFDPAGFEKWTFPTGLAVYSSPAISADGTVYVGSDDGNLYAINSADGTLKWKFATAGAVTSSPAIGSDGTIYVGSGDGNVYAIH
jgi:outer membrane protein assembly factor BamB